MIDILSFSDIPGLKTKSIIKVQVLFIYLILFENELLDRSWCRARRIFKRKYLNLINISFLNSIIHF